MRRKLAPYPIHVFGTVVVAATVPFFVLRPFLARFSAQVEQLIIRSAKVS